MKLLTATLALVLTTGLLAPATAQQRPHLPFVRPTLPTAPAAGATLAARTSTSVLRPGQVMKYAYDSLAHAWASPVQIRLSYDAQGRETLSVAADSASRQPLWRVNTAYDAAGHKTEERYEVSVGSTWLDSYRHRWTYDAHQQLTEDVYQNNVNGAWQTDAGEQYQNVYDATGRLTRQTIRGFRRRTGTFADSLRNTYSGFDARGAWSAMLMEETDASGQWQNAEQRINVTWYDFAQGLMASADGQMYTGMGWQTIARLTGTYSATRHEQVITGLLPGGWGNVQRWVSTFDSYGNLTDSRIDDWNVTNWETVIETVFTLAYNADGTLRRRIMLADIDGSGLTPSTLENFSQYQTIVLAAALPRLPAGALQAFPNPSTDGRFTVQLTTRGPGEVRVTDALGRPVYQQKASATTFTLDLGQQPAGLYTLELRTAVGVARQQLLVR